MIFWWMLLVVFRVGFAGEVCFEDSLDPDCVKERSLLGLRNRRGAVDFAREDSESMAEEEENQGEETRKEGNTGADSKQKGGEDVSLESNTEILTQENSEEKGRGEAEMESNTTIQPGGWGRCYSNGGLLDGCKNFFRVQSFFNHPRAQWRDNCIQKECWLSNLTWDPTQWQPCHGVLFNLVPDDMKAVQGKCVPIGSVKTDAIFPPKCETKFGWQLKRDAENRKQPCLEAVPPAPVPPTSEPAPVPPTSEPAPVPAPTPPPTKGVGWTDCYKDEEWKTCGIDWNVINGIQKSWFRRRTSNRDYCIMSECRKRGLWYNTEKWHDCGGWKFKGWCHER